MIHCYLLLTTGYLYGTLPFPIGPLTIPMLHCYLLLATGYLYGILPSPFGQLAISMVHYVFLLVHWLSLWYTTIFYWPTNYPNDTLPYPYDTIISSTGPLDIEMVHYLYLCGTLLSLVSGQVRRQRLLLFHATVTCNQYNLFPCGRMGLDSLGRPLV